MSRIRSIYPGQWTDEEFVALSAFARLLVLGVRNEADDNGVFEWKPLQLKMRLFPADAVDIDALLAELEEHRHVTSYRANGGRKYGIIRNFVRWQRPRRPSALYPMPEAGSVDPEFLPANPNAQPELPRVDDRQPAFDLVDSAAEEPAEHAPETGFPTLSDTVRPYLVSSMCNRRSSERSARASPRGSFAEADFEKWWKVYPNQVAEPAARRLFPTALAKASLDELIEATERYKASKPRDREWCNPATWLRDERWRDHPSTLGASPSQSPAQRGPTCPPPHHVPSPEAAALLAALSRRQG